MTQSINSQTTAPKNLEKFETLKEGIDTLSQLQNVTYDLSSLMEAVASVWGNIERSKGIAPDPEYCRMICPGDVKALSYLVKRCHDLSDDLNSSLLDCLSRLERLEHGFKAIRDASTAAAPLRSAPNQAILNPKHDNGSALNDLAQLHKTRGNQTAGVCTDTYPFCVPRGSPEGSA